MWPMLNFTSLGAFRQGKKKKTQKNITRSIAVYLPNLTVLVCLNEVAYSLK